MTKLIALLSLLSAPAAADPQSNLQHAASLSNAAVSGGSNEAASSGSAFAFLEKSGATPVNTGANPQYAAADKTANITNAKATTMVAHAEAPPSPKTGFMEKAGSTLKEYTPHLLTAGIGGAAGAVVAKVGGFGLLGSIAAGAGIGLAAMYLYKKGQTGAAIGAASFGLAGLALGGPIGGLAGAVVGGLGAWLLGKFFS